MKFWLQLVSKISLRFILRHGLRLFNCFCYLSSEILFNGGYRLLHRSSVLWEFHKVHHSVEQMGFVHLRFHWMETVVYRTIEYIPLAMIGFGIDDFFMVYMFTPVVGHWNHSNLKINLGPLKYVLNNPNMHMWHHAYDLPEDKHYGVNFGLTLSIWDYYSEQLIYPIVEKRSSLVFQVLKISLRNSGVR